MVSGATSNTARKKAREHAAALLDAEDAEKRRLEAQRRKRITDNAAEVAGNDTRSAELAEEIEQLRADSARRVAAIVADGVSEEQAAAMTGREVRDVRSAVKAAAVRKAAAPKRKQAGARGAAPESAAA